MEIPVTGIPAGVAAKIEVYVEPVPGETETRKQQGHLPGDLLAVGRRRARGRAARAAGAPAAAANLWRWPPRSPTRRASSRSPPPRWRCCALLGCAALAADASRRLRRAQRSLLGERDEARPDRARGGDAGGLRSAARLRRRDGASGSTGGLADVEGALRGTIAHRALVRYDAYNELSGPAVDVDRAARRRAVGDRAVVHPPPRPGARVRQAGARRARRTRALAGGGRGGAPRARGEAGASALAGGERAAGAAEMAPRA